MELNYYKKWKYWPNILLMAVFLFWGATTVNAQKVLWDTGFPKMSSETLGTYGDPQSLGIKFSVSDAPLTNPEFKVTLPTGIKVSEVLKEAGDNSGVDYTMEENGQTLTIKASGPINMGAHVDLKVVLTMESCDETDNAEFKVELYSGGVVVANTTRTTVISVKRPTLRALAPQSTIVVTEIGDQANFKVNIDVANELKAKSLVITLAKDEFTTLSNFKLDGTDITSKVTIAGNDVTVLLDESVLQGTLVGKAVKVLTFDASANIGASRTMTMAGKYPADANCSVIASQKLTLTNPTIPGTANFQLPNDGTYRRWVLASDMDGTNLAPNTGVVMDGQTISYLRLQYLNGGSAGAIQVKNRVMAYRSQPYTYGYIVPDQIQYSIDNGVTKKTVPASDVRVITTLKENNGYRLLKPQAVGKAENVEVTINEFVDAGKYIIIYWPIIQGDIYDNDTYRPTISAGTAPFSSLQFMQYFIEAKDANGTPAAVPSNTYGNGGINLPKFMTSLSSQGLRELEHEESQITFDLGAVNATDNQSVDFNVKIPPFLEIDGTMEEAIQFLGVDVSGKVQYTDLGGGHYRVRFTGNPTQPDPVTGNPVGTAINTVEFKYKAIQCSGSNQSGEIEYWLDYNLGGNNPLRPTLKKIAKLYQPVTLFCEKDGIEMKDFKLFRITRGLKDSNENYVPDDGQMALDEEIRHNIYLKNDEGKILLTGLTLGAYNNLYMLLTTDFKLKADVLKIGDATIKVGDGAEENVNFTHASNDSLFYIEYNKPIAANTNVTISVPFKVVNANNLSKAFDVELYVSNTKQTNPFNPVDRVGVDKTGRTIIAYLEAFATDRGNETFTNNEVKQKMTFPYFDSYHGNNFYSPFFSKEVRRLAKPLKYEFELPPGFLLKSDLTVTNTQRRDQHLQNNPVQTMPVQSAQELANGNTLYTFDFASVFQDNVDTQAQADALPANKWMHPDDFFYFNFVADVQATKGAAADTKVQGTITYIDAVEDNAELTKKREFNISYTGDRTALDIPTNNIKAQEAIIHIPIATVSNPNAYPTEMWLYVEGNVKNVSATPVSGGGGGTRIVGTGLEGRWVALGTIPARTAPSFAVDYEAITTICSPETIRVYTVSRFQEVGWTPNIDAPVDADDIDHVAASKPVFLTPTQATVQASISTSSNELVFGTPYNLTASLDSKASESALLKPEMKIAIPAGQQYVAGTAKVEYPVGTINAVPSDVEAKLISTLANVTDGTRELVMNVNELIGSDVLHGFGDNTVTDKDRVVSLTLTFTPVCETPLTGIRFDGQPYGENFCQEVAIGAEKHERSSEMYSTLNADYKFAVNPIMVSGNRAFNEIRKEDKLKVDIAKIEGTDALLANDALYIYMPKYMDLKDAANIEINSTDIPAVEGSKATVVSNTEAEDTRTIVLKLPVDDINALTDNGLNKGLSYTIDLVYSPNKEDAYLVNNPEQSIRTIVTTNKQFSPSCPDAPLAIGTGKVDIALVTASENPYKGIINTELTLEIISSGFAGEWFDVETGGTALSSQPTYNYTPTDTDDKTFYVSSIFNGVNYGRVPVLLNTLPGVDFTVTNPAPICIDSEVDLASFITDLQQGVTIKFYSDPAATNELTDSKVVVKGPITYYAQASNGTATSQIKEIVIDTLAPTEITTQPVTADVNYDGTITLSVVATGDNLTYQWQKDGADIAGATSATYTKANATETESGVYSVVVTGDCGSVTSDDAQVTVYPDLEITITNPAPICASESIDLANFVTVKPGVTVKYYSDAAAQNELASSTVKPNATTTYYVKADNGLSSGEVKEITVETLKPTEITTQPTIVKIVEGGSITLSVTATGENLTYQWKKDGVDIAGATSATFSKGNATDADNGVYSVVATGDCGAATSENAQVTVYPDTDITIGTPAPVCISESVDLANFVTVKPGVTVKYYSDAAAQNELTSSTVKPNATTTYYVKADNGLSGGKIEEIIVETLDPTEISAQPVAVKVETGATITLTVAATGQDLNYQWQKDGTDIAGATSATYTKASATDVENGAYSVQVTGKCGTVVSTTAQVTVYPDTDIVVTNPAPICASESIDLANFVSAKPGVTVKYYSDAAAQNELASSTVKPNATTTYYVKADNGLSGGEVKEITVETLAPTEITTQPVDVKVVNGGTITLSVTAKGENLTYQWKKDGVDIAGATSATYTKASATDADNGVYSVVVTGDCSTVTSENAQVTVYPDTDIVVTNPAPICASESIDLANFVSAKPGVTVKYYSDAAAQNELASSTVKPNATTTYYVKADNGLSSGEVKEITVETLAPTEITTQPVDVKVMNGGTITLSVTAKGENLTYQWKKDGVDIAGATSATYTKAKATDVENGVYSVVVIGDCGTVTSSNAQVTVYPSLELTISTPAPICASESIDLANFVTAKPGVTVKYYSDAESKNELTSTVVKPNVSTTYYAQAVSAGGAKGTLQPIEVTVNPLAEAKIASVTDIVCANTEGQITLALTGTAPWTVVYTDGTKDYTVTATSSSYTFNVMVAQATTFTLKSVEDALGCGLGKVDGSSATIRVEEAVRIVSQPSSITFCEGDAFSLEVEATGAVEEYQWYHNGTAISGETSSRLVVNNATKAESGEYHVVVIGKCGSVTSNKVQAKANLSDIIVQKWNNTLVANNNATTNGGYNFVSYRWFLEGELIDQGPYHTVGSNPTNTLEMGKPYTLEVTTDKGEVFVTCPYYPVLKSASVKLYPTVVNANEPVYLEVETEDGSVPSGKVEIYNILGIGFKAPKISDRITTISLPIVPGVYILKFKSTDINQDFKVIVK